MPPYTNLVSDSTLVQDTIDLLNDAGGRAAASEIVDAVFKLSHIDDELAGLLVADLIRNDRRFKIIENNKVELQGDASQSSPPDERARDIAGRARGECAGAPAASPTRRASRRAPPAPRPLASRVRGAAGAGPERTA